MILMPLPMKRNTTMVRARVTFRIMAHHTTPATLTMDIGIMAIITDVPTDTGDMAAETKDIVTKLNTFSDWLRVCKGGIRSRNKHHTRSMSVL